MATKNKADEAQAPAAKIKPAVIVTVAGGKISADPYDSYTTAKQAYDAIVADCVAGKSSKADSVSIFDKHGERKRFSPAKLSERMIAQAKAKAEAEDEDEKPAPDSD